MWYVFNTKFKDMYVKERHVQLLLDDSKIIGVCGLNDSLLSAANSKQCGFSLELSKYAEKQFSIPVGRERYTEALGVITYNLGQVHLRIYKFRRKKGSHTYKRFKHDYYIDWVG